MQKISHEELRIEEVIKRKGEKLYVKWKGATWIVTPNLAAKSDLASLKAEIGKIYVEKLKIVPVDLSRLSNVVNKEVVKKLYIIN